MNSILKRQLIYLSPLGQLFRKCTSQTRFKNSDSTTERAIGEIEIEIVQGIISNILHPPVIVTDFSE